MTKSHGPLILSYILTLSWYLNMLPSDNEYDQTSDLKVVIGHSDLILWPSDFALFFDTRLV